MAGKAAISLTTGLEDLSGSRSARPNKAVRR
jgi:hypothetical protein